MNEINLSKKLLYIPAKADLTRDLWLPFPIHAQDTAGVMNYLCENWVCPQLRRAISENLSEDQFKNLCIFLAYVHDIGKVTPVTIRKLLKDQPNEMESRLEKIGLRIPPSGIFVPDERKSPHALAGESILLKLGVPVSLSAVVGAHHGKPQSVGAYTHQTEKYYKNYFAGYDSESEWTALWEEWLGYALSNVTLSVIEQLPEIDMAGQILLTALVITADWIASNELYFPLIPTSDSGEFISEQDRIKAGIWKLNLPHYWTPEHVCLSDADFLAEFGFPPNAVQSCVIRTVKEHQHSQLVIIESPMGSGKTEAALAAAEILAKASGAGGIFFGLPTQSTANGNFSRLESWAKGQSEETVHAIRLAHAMAELNESYRSIFHGTADIDSDEPDTGLIIHDWFSGRKQALMAEFAIGTIDQLLMAALQQKHVMLRLLGLAGKVVVLDEVHSYDAYMTTYLETALRWLGALHVPVIMLSATLPSDKKRKLIEAYTGEKCDLPDSNVYPVLTYVENNEVHQEVIPSNDKPKTVHIRRENDENISEIIKDALKDGGCAGIIVNTVKQAQKIYAELSETVPDYDVLLIHAGFTAADRAEKERTVIERTGMSSDTENRNKLVVIGTQVLEQSLDIDFDIMITDLCPMDLLLQRIGRLHRHDRIRPGTLNEPTCIVLGTSGDPETGSEFIYGRWLLLRTKQLLPGEITLPDDIPGLVRLTYEAPSDDILSDSDFRASWESYQSEIAKNEEKAKAFRLAEPNRRKNSKRIHTIHGMLDVAVKDAGSGDTAKDAKMQMAVRNSEPSLQVLVMVKDADGNVRFLPWIENGKCVPIDRAPPEETAITMARQRLTLPRVLCHDNMIDGTISELEDMDEDLVNWQDSQILHGDSFLLLGEDLTTEINGYIVSYSKNNGSLCVKVK